jgi:hypothetical protein
MYELSPSMSLTVWVCKCKPEEPSSGNQVTIGIFRRALQAFKDLLQLLLRQFHLPGVAGTPVLNYY